MHRLIIDTETTGPLNAPMVYDVGIIIIDDALQVIESGRWLVAETFNNAKLMDTAYYANKLPGYYADIDAGHVQVVPLATIRNELMGLCAAHGIREVWAYNAAFDRRALCHTVETVSNGLQDSMLPPDIPWRDLWPLACNTILCKPGYLRFINRHGLLTPRGNPQTSAQAAYAYITRQPDYTEEHTALADARIEAAILAHILRRKCKRKPYSSIGTPSWPVVARAYRNH